SMRRILAPIPTAVKPARSNSAIPSSVHPPSGPISSVNLAIAFSLATSITTSLIARADSSSDKYHPTPVIAPPNPRTSFTSPLLPTSTPRHPHAPLLIKPLHLLPHSHSQHIPRMMSFPLFQLDVSNLHPLHAQSSHRRNYGQREDHGNSTQTKTVLRAIGRLM